eukprot:scaffold83266_cov48-Phaeocystis_antarctica.AAC.1
MGGAAGERHVPWSRPWRGAPCTVAERGLTRHLTCHGAPRGRLRLLPICQGRQPEPEPEP